MKVLAIDVGGTHVKALVTGARTPRKVDSGPTMTARRMVTAVKKLAEGWTYDAVSIGYPGLVVHDRIAAEPKNLGGGWVGLDFTKAFGRPVRIINDAAMQAIGSYAGGRMLFLGLGTGLGSAMIVDHRIEPLELAHLPYRHGKTYEDYLGVRGMERLGKKKWRRHVLLVIDQLSKAMEPDYVVLGGGNVRKIGALPPGVREGKNTNAFLGGFRLWTEDRVHTHRPVARVVRARSAG